MAITLNGSTGIGTPGVSSTDAITGTTGAFSGNVTANGLSTELRPLVLGTSQASTSGTTVDFTDIPSWVKRVTVMFNGVSTSGTSLPIVRVGTSSGIASSGYSGVVTQTTSSVLMDTSGVQIYDTAPSAASVISGSMVFSLFSGTTWEAQYAVIDVNGTTYRQKLGTGFVTLSGTLDRIRITTVNGTDTFDAGTINIMYE